MANLVPLARSLTSGDRQVLNSSDTLTDSSGNVIVPSSPRNLSQTNSINLLSTGGTTLLTVPTGKTFIPNRVILVITAASGVSADAVADIRTSSAGDIFSSQTLTNIRATNDVFVFDVSSAKSITVAAGSNITLQVTTAATGTTLTASAYLQGWYANETTAQNGGLAVPGPYSCSVYRSGTQGPITSSTLTAVTYSNEYFDNGNMHSTITNSDRITIQYAGRYLLVFNIHMPSVSTNVYTSAVILNSSGVQVANSSAQGASSSNPTIVTSCIVSCSVGDYFTSNVFIVAAGTSLTSVGIFSASLLVGQ